jgi:hypothetical protein
MKLRHPHSDQTIDVDPEQRQLYTTEGWTDAPETATETISRPESPETLGPSAIAPSTMKTSKTKRPV